MSYYFLSPDKTKNPPPNITGVIWGVRLILQCPVCEKALYMLSSGDDLSMGIMQAAVWHRQICQDPYVNWTPEQRGYCK